MLVDSTLIYPYLPVIFFDPGWIEQNKTTALALVWRSALVSFFVKKEFNPREAFLVGSGFLYLCGGQMPCIVTASHVIVEMRKSEISFISIDGVKFPFGNLEIFFNDEQDYAVIPLPERIAKAIPDSRMFTSIYDSNDMRTSSFVIMGFPAKHNNLHALRPDKGLTPFNITFHSFHYERETEDIFFHFVPNGKKKNITFEESSTTTSIPSLAGMSGAVIAQIVAHRTSGQLSLVATGIFKEHRMKKGDYLVGATFIDFADEVNALIK